MKLSYSEYKSYLDCPKKYKYQKDRVKPAVTPSKYFALYGITVQKFFELYSNLYSKNGKVLTEIEVKGYLRGIWNKVLQDNYVDWNEPWCKFSSVDLFEQAYSDVIENLKVFDDFFRHSESEKKIIINLKNSGDSLVSKVDFIHKDNQGKVTILDGKGTDEIGKNIDADQLYFYALVYLIHYKKMPDLLGILYWRMRQIVYYDFTYDTIIKFKNKLALVKNAIKADTKFEAKIGLSKQCKWCDFRYQCDEYTQKKEANKEKRGKKSALPDYNGELQTVGFKK